ncbi:MAG: hypothetical protein M0C28_44910 [Candidatus Moduliflexus flocculans]|nr:hypothetical protein [Candidatus Moduliflexus flocculans]
MQLGLEGSTGRYERSLGHGRRRHRAHSAQPPRRPPRLHTQDARTRKWPPSSARPRRAADRISLGGLALLLRPYLDEFREGEFHLRAARPHRLQRRRLFGRQGLDPRRPHRQAGVHRPHRGRLRHRARTLGDEHQGHLQLHRNVRPDRGLLEPRSRRFPLPPRARPPGLHRRSRDGSAPPQPAAGSSRSSRPASRAGPRPPTPRSSSSTRPRS